MLKHFGSIADPPADRFDPDQFTERPSRA
jgi:hypothetical protein